MKKFTSIILTACMVASFSNNVFAQEDKKEVKNETVINLTITDVANRLKNDNIELKMIDEKIKLYNKLYGRDHAKAIEADNSGRSDVESKKTALLYAGQSAQRAEDAEHEKDSRFKEIKHDLERQYLNIVNCDREIDIINKSMKNVEEEIKKVNANVEQGKVTANTLDSLKVKKAQLLASLNLPKAQREEALLKIKQYLNIDKNTQINFYGAKKDFIKFEDTNINDLIKNALDKNYNLKKQKQNIEFAKLEEKIYMEYGRNSEDEETDLKIRMNDLQNSFENDKTNLEVDIWKAYYDLMSKQNIAEIEKLNLENIKSKYNEMEAKLKQGLIDKLTLDSTELQMEKQNVTAEKAINEYMITLEYFKDLLEGF
ncbi:TolC family protein [Clostridium lundense]|uniref:TolC family protein n=1 Tax=Clostridium lundense TaxID=319475 RepID=UPI0004838B74|nr:TolC family protein [Clostridium lundense]